MSDVRRSLLLLGILAVVSTQLTPSDAATGWQTKRYEVPSAGVSLPGFKSPVGNPKDGKMNIGGVTFPPLGGSGFGVVEIVISDDRSRNVGVSICQDARSNGDLCLSGRGKTVGATLPFGECMRSGSWVQLRVDRALPIHVQVSAATVCGYITTLLVPYVYGVGHATTGTVYLREL